MPRSGQLIQAANADTKTGSEAVKERELRQPVLFIILGLIPLVSWAKHRMHEHTIAQMIMATILSTVATLTIFYYSGLI
jgi:hypothetical protein